ncbi:hypothetical protein LTR10_011810 [Elasticomyces elasticus]|nr:hypothetical protein LTR10_011810 [Elasticomyces elasticus]
MGLHREATYANRPDGGRLRRLWWVLVNADRLQAACFGRPLAVRYSDCDTKKPSTADFSQSDTSSLIFIHYIGLAAVWGEIADYGNRGKSASTADITRLTDTLCTWIGTLPEESRLFGPNGVRLPYRQSVSELHMVYFVTIILLEAMRIRSREHWATATASIIAASCTARLIEEVDCWEDLSSMSSSITFYIMAASIPLLHLQTNQPEKREIRQQDLQILCTTLERMAPRWGGAAVVRQNIEKILNMVEWHNSDTHSRNAEQGVDQDANGSPWRYKLEELFPFPRTLSPTLDLLSNTTPPLEFDIMDLPLADDALPWPDNESQSYLDFFRFNMYGDRFDIGEESVGPLNTIGG